MKRGPLLHLLPDGAWAGQRVVIVGGGPSLKGFDFSRLRGEIVVGVNRAFQVCPCALNLTMDQRFVKWINNAEFGPPTAFYSGTGTPTFYVPDMAIAARYPELAHVLSGGNSWAWSLDAPQVRTNNSGMAAIQVACSLGATEAYLLGFDMDDTPRRQEWFHSGYSTVQPASVYVQFRAALETHAPAIRERARVVNCNPKSALKCFEFGGLPEPRRRPLVVSYYTENTSYEAEAQRMVDSAHRHGFETDVRAVPTLGGWTANTYAKAAFIRLMMDVHPDRDILWLDADSEVLRYPALLDDAREDLALVAFNWHLYGGTGREVSSAVMMVRNNARARTVVEAWIEKNRQHRVSGRWEMTNLKEVIDAGPAATVRWLPDTYCQIFDRMAAGGPAVIRQHQASRRLRKEVGP